MNNKKRIQYLINQCLSKSETLVEREELEGYLLMYSDSNTLHDLIEDSFGTDGPLEDIGTETSDAIFESIVATAYTQNKRSNIKSVYIKWASIAALLVLILSPLLIIVPYSVFNSGISHLALFSSVPDTTKCNCKENVALPSEDNALLTTSNGSVFRLDQLEVGSSIDLDGLKVEKIGLSKVSFVYDSMGIQHSNAYNNTLVTPRGSRYTVALADGSVVELNAASKLVFPSRFDTKERLVSLEGEAFFDVMHDANRKFIVHASSSRYQQDVIVHGTKFNINSYPTSAGILTTLVEGSVQVKSSIFDQFMEPSQQVLFQDGRFILSPANLDLNLAWKNELFYFADESIEHVMQEISRWYDVDISYQGDIPNIKIWGQISRKKALSEILEILSKANELTFKVVGKEVIVMN